MVHDLAEVFDLKDMSKLTYFLGLQIQYQEDGSLFISQSKYARDLLHKTGMDHCIPTSTSSKPHTQPLNVEGVPMIDPGPYISISRCITILDLY